MRQFVSPKQQISKTKMNWWRGRVFNGEGNGTPIQYSCLENPMDGGAWWTEVHGVTESWTWLRGFTFTFHFHALEKEMVIHSSILAWRIPGTGNPGGLPSMGLHRVGHDWSNLAAAAAAATIWGRNISFYECKNGDSEVQLMCFIHAKRLQDGIWTQVCLVPEPSFCSWSFALSYYAKS